jgi:enoyl reductase-like protein
VSKQVDNPRQGHEYEDLKEALLKAYGKSRREKAAQLANMGGLGSRKPSHLLSDMRALLGTESDDHMLFEHHFLANLPDDIRVALAQSEGSIDALAAAADKMWQEKLLSQPTSMVAAIKGATPSRATNTAPTDVCYYHETFKDKAKKCRPGCKFFKSGKASASQ